MFHNLVLLDNRNRIIFEALTLVYPKINFSCHVKSEKKENSFSSAVYVCKRTHGQTGYYILGVQWTEVRCL